MTTTPGGRPPQPAAGPAAKRPEEPAAVRKVRFGRCIAAHQCVCESAEQAADCAANLPPDYLVPQFTVISGALHWRAIPGSDWSHVPERLQIHMAECWADTMLALSPGSSAPAIGLKSSQG